jgi:hypothetical protein
LARGKGLKGTVRYVESALIWRLIMGPYDRITSSFYLPHALNGGAPVKNASEKLYIMQAVRK